MTKKPEPVMVGLNAERITAVSNASELLSTNAGVKPDRMLNCTVPALMAMLPVKSFTPLLAITKRAGALFGDSRGAAEFADAGRGSLRRNC